MARRINRVPSPSGYEPSFHAKVTRQITEQFQLENGRRNYIIQQGGILGISLKVEPLPDPLVEFVKHAKNKAKHCKCGSIHCNHCGFLAFHQRVQRVAKSNISGYLTGGAA